MLNILLAFYTGFLMALKIVRVWGMTLCTTRSLLEWGSLIRVKYEEKSFKTEDRYFSS